VWHGAFFFPKTLFSSISGLDSTIIYEYIAFLDLNLRLKEAGHKVQVFPQFQVLYYGIDPQFEEDTVKTLNARWETKLSATIRGMDIFRYFLLLYIPGYFLDIFKLKYLFIKIQA
jgi:hypothetical protein